MIHPTDPSDTRTLEELMSLGQQPSGLTIFNIGPRTQVNIREQGSEGWACTTGDGLVAALRKAFQMRRCAWPEGWVEPVFEQPAVKYGQSEKPAIHERLDVEIEPGVFLVHWIL